MPRTQKHLPITRRGAAVAGGAAALLVGGFIAADGWLMVLGLCGIAVMIFAFIWAKLNLASLHLTSEVAGRIHAGRDTELRLALQNSRRFCDAFQVEIFLKLPGKTKVETLAPWTPASGISEKVLNVSIPRRGYREQHPLTLTSTFPLGLFRLRKKQSHHMKLTVLPRLIVPREINEDGSSYDAEPRHGANMGQNFGEPRGIRPWQAGDSARRIHWPASARSLTHGHGLRVREFDPPGFHPDHCHIIFHSYASGGEMLREDRFERAISLLAGAINELQARGIPTQVTADFFDWQSHNCHTRAQWAEFFYRLVHAQRSKGVETHDLQSALRSVPADHTMMIISDMPPESWLHLLESHPHTLVIDIRQVKYRVKTLHAKAS